MLDLYMHTDQKENIGSNLQSKNVLRYWFDQHNILELENLNDNPNTFDSQVKQNNRQKSKVKTNVAFKLQSNYLTTFWTSESIII